MSNDIEYEGKVLNIDIPDIQDKLKKLGATKQRSYAFRRYILDTIPAKKGRWVRLRTDGNNTTLCVKEIASNAIDGTSEWEVEVSDIDTTLKILNKIGLEPRSYQENTREEYKLEDSLISIDTWPKLKPYIEIEAANTELVIATAKQLGFDEDDLTGDNTEYLYQQVGIDLQKIKDLRFE